MAIGCMEMVPAIEAVGDRDYVEGRRGRSAEWNAGRQAFTSTWPRQSYVRVCNLVSFYRLHKILTDPET